MIEILSWASALAGSILIVIGAVGMLRMPDFETRSHAASLIDVLGASLIVIAVILHYGWAIVSLKLALIILFLVVTSPVAIHSLFNIHQAKTPK